MTTSIITLDVAGKELKFAPTMVAYNGFINDMMPSDKVALALRRHYLPHDEDDIDSLARALWLDRHARESHAAAVAEGIANAFNG